MSIEALYLLWACKLFKKHSDAFSFINKFNARNVPNRIN